MYVIRIPKRHVRRVVLVVSAFLIVSGATLLVYNVAYANKIFPGVRVGILNVGGLTREEAGEALERSFADIQDRGVRLLIEGSSEIIRSEDVGFVVKKEETINRAWVVGRRGTRAAQMKERVQASFTVFSFPAEIEVSEESLENEIATLAELYDEPRKDVRFYIEDAEVSVLYDTETGKILDRAEIKNTVWDSLRSLDSSPITITRRDDLPRGSATLSDEAKEEAERILANPLRLVYAGRTFSLSRTQIGSWIISVYEGDKLLPDLDEKAVSFYVTEIADQINSVSQDIRVRVVDDKVVDFIAPRSGKILEEEETIKLIIDVLNDRRDGSETTQELSLPVTIKKPLIDETAASLGITELIGKGTTPFTGSPKNRIHNIENGATFLSGIIIQPGEEFSTIGALGRIDNTTGYLPELVIKGNRTIPEYGGGLCQVSTTLFRTVLDAGLPITARRNHSYRVPYYERDGDGNFIGPGLDATIYSPNPDFRFTNDTDSAILIQGYVVGDKITFELYGTKDGRVAEVDGPYTLSTFGAGAPIYVETDTLEQGVTKRLEIAHAGGTAVASYKVTYPDGTVNEQEFKSYYRGWPARYLVGTRE